MLCIRNIPATYPAWPGSILLSPPFISSSSAIAYALTFFPLFPPLSIFYSFQSIFRCSQIPIMAPGSGRDFNCSWEHCGKVGTSTLSTWFRLTRDFVVFQSQVRSLSPLSHPHQWAAVSLHRKGLQQELHSAQCLDRTLEDPHGRKAPCLWPWRLSKGILRRKRLFFGILEGLRNCWSLLVIEFGPPSPNPHWQAAIHLPRAYMRTEVSTLGGNGRSTI